MTTHNFTTELQGKTIESIEGGQVGSDCITFSLSSGEKYRLKYYQDCCAQCTIEDICGDLNDLIGYPLVVAEEVFGESGIVGDEEYGDHYTWVYYKLDTIKGGITIRWYGSSNGYYSEEATFEKLNGNDENDDYNWIS